jgi:hexosaminidase
VKNQAHWQNFAVGWRFRALAATLFFSKPGTVVGPCVRQAVQCSRKQVNLMTFWSFRGRKTVTGATLRVCGWQAASLLAMTAISANGWAQQVSLMPMPSSVQRADGALVVTPPHGMSGFSYHFTQTHDERLETAADRMWQRLDRTCGGDLRASEDAAMGGVPASETAATTPLTAVSSAGLAIAVAGPGETIQGLDENESYSLKVTPAGATLTAATDVGAMHGMETLLQLAGNAGGACVLPAVTIDDAPRFRWRGFMLDVSRHFEPVAVIERTLDGMVVAKLNVFHWHLSDDQGFRAQSLKYPRLTEFASDGQFYTQDQMREVVAYARARGIRVVPEFDMPGHSISWILAYPEIGSGEHFTRLPMTFGTPEAELDPSNEKTYKFVDGLVGEMGKIFPDAYFHIGGDETAGKHWLSNPKIKTFMDRKGFTTAAQLQAYFNQRLLPILKKHGKTMIGWDEILNPALPKDIVIQSWRGEASLSAGAREGYKGILSAPYYLDGEKTSAQMFLDDPIPADTPLSADQQKLILGGEICMWAEQLHPETVDSRVWPRTLAVAERLWSPQSDRDVPYMYERLRRGSLELEDAGLTQISGPEKLRRNLTGNLHPEALDLLASVTEPFSFGERYEGQHTSDYTSLDRFVDAVVADPSSRQKIAGDVQAITGHLSLPPLPKDAPNASGDVPEGFAPNRGAAYADLRRNFLEWQRTGPALLELSQETPRLNDTGPLATELSQMGALGMESLSFVEARTRPTDGWYQQAQAQLDAAQNGAALVHFTFLNSLRRLVDAAMQQPAAPPVTPPAE